MKRIRLFVSGSLICNLFVVVAFAYCAIHFFTNSSVSSSIDYFRYFTNLSNLFAFIVCLIYLPFNIMNIVKGKDHYPLWLRITKFTAVISVTVTFLTVMLFLGPTQGYAYMLQSDMIFMHLLNPVFAIIGYLLFESNETFRWPYSFIGTSSVVVYGLVYTINVLGTKVWEDFYGFNRGGHGVSIYFVMILLTFALSEGVYYLQKFVLKHLRMPKN